MKNAPASLYILSGREEFVLILWVSQDYLVGLGSMVD